jgi:hypothetical protein
MSWPERERGEHQSNKRRSNLRPIATTQRRTIAMTSLTLLAEMHVREFVSRQKQQDEINKQDSASRQGDSRKQARKELGDWQQSAINCAGPLCVLDAIGQAEESWVEMFEHAPRCDLQDRDKQANHHTKEKAGGRSPAQLNLKMA